jgi:aerobic-type carbon monoxide dehydrogenase small subunit (CoxS/CutS family)
MSNTPSQTYHSTISLTVNGRPRRLKAAHHWTLLELLRDALDLIGAKRGCDRGECGACTVLLDGLPVYSCQMLALQAKGRSVTTVEALSTDGSLHPLQQSMLEADSGQCGYCTPGFVMSAYALLQRNPSPTETDIRDALVGNLCRCNAYGRIITGIQTAAQLLTHHFGESRNPESSP